MGDITGSRARKDAKRDRRAAQAELADAKRVESQKKKKLDSERVRLLRARSSRTPLDVIDSKTTGGAQQQIPNRTLSSLLG